MGCKIKFAANVCIFIFVSEELVRVGGEVFAFTPRLRVAARKIVLKSLHVEIVERTPPPSALRPRITDYALRAALNDFSVPKFFKEVLPWQYLYSVVGFSRN